MVVQSFTELLALIQGGGYLLIFIGMFIEGPIVAFIAGFLAALGFFNPFILVLLFILGNQIPDSILFYIGRFSRGKLVYKILSYFKINKKELIWLEKNIKKHLIKTTVFYKTVPPLPLPGIVISGFAKVPFRKFFFIDLIYNIFYAIFFVALGYYSGIITDTSLRLFKLGQFVLLGAAAAAAILYFLIKWIISKEIFNVNKLVS